MARVPNKGPGNKPKRNPPKLPSFGEVIRGKYHAPKKKKKKPAREIPGKHFYI
jgi:hypothetical protein